MDLDLNIAVTLELLLQSANSYQFLVDRRCFLKFMSSGNCASVSGRFSLIPGSSLKSCIHWCSLGRVVGHDSFHLLERGNPTVTQVHQTKHVPTEELLISQRLILNDLEYFQQVFRRLLFTLLRACKEALKCVALRARSRDRRNISSLQNKNDKEIALHN